MSTRPGPMKNPLRIRSAQVQQFHRYVAKLDGFLREVKVMHPGAHYRYLHGKLFLLREKCVDVPLDASTLARAPLDAANPKGEDPRGAADSLREQYAALGERYAALGERYVALREQLEAARRVLR